MSEFTNFLRMIYSERSPDKLAFIGISLVCSWIFFSFSHNVWTAILAGIISFIIMQVALGYLLIPYLKNKHKARKELQKINKLSDSEKAAVLFFVRRRSPSILIKIAEESGCIEGIYSLKLKGLVKECVAPDGFGLSLAFLLDENIFDLANANRGEVDRFDIG